MNLILYWRSLFLRQTKRSKAFWVAWPSGTPSVAIDWLCVLPGGRSELPPDQRQNAPPVGRPPLFGNIASSGENGQWGGGADNHFTLRQKNKGPDPYRPGWGLGGSTSLLEWLSDRRVMEQRASLAVGLLVRSVWSASGRLWGGHARRQHYTRSKDPANTENQTYKQVCSIELLQQEKS